MASLIQDLQDPFMLPDPTEQISVIQTHISVVFVADAFVYKVKKPVNFGFLDFSTLEKRKFYCEQEIKLNRRLSQGIYLDVLPITHKGQRYTMRADGGTPVEYAVKMKRIPAEILMKSLFHRGELSEAHLRRIADVLARFHLTARRSTEIDRYGEPRGFKVNTDENFDQVRNYIGRTIQRHQFDLLECWTNDFFAFNKDLFRRRIEQGRIRDCHGDLHMEHVCLGDPIAIIDCIEFNDRFRYSDTMADVAFLLMDLEYHGGAALSNLLWAHYKALAGEEEGESLLTFYKIYRAFVRGKVNSFQVDDDAMGVREKEAAAQRAQNYFRLAASYATP
jgi:aminoglycoside phosphotransferase family enzyme